jgi:glycosyltransferase involved in cell wall biosynthesis
MNILWIPHASWTFEQREKTFCKELGKRHNIHVTNINTYFTAGDYLTPKYVKGLFYRKQTDDHITIHNIPQVSPALYSKKLRELNRKLYLKHANKIIRKERIECVIGCFLCPPPDCGNLILDVCDDHPTYWRELRAREDYAQEIKEIHRQYLEKTSKVVAVGNVLKKRFNYTDAKVIPNAVDVELFRTASGEKIRDSLTSDRKIIGLFGNQDFPEELELLLDAAEKLRDSNTLFITVGRGSAMKKAAREKDRRMLENVRFLEPVPFKSMPDYYAALDVSLCLKKPSKFWNASCPIKILEATASGRSIVSTRLTEVESWEFPNISYTEYTPESLAEAITQALEAKEARNEKINRFDVKKLTAEYEKTIEE